jgi:hypothetical protein
METLILNSKSKKDATLLIDIAKRIGLDLKIAPKNGVIEESYEDIQRRIKFDKLRELARKIDASVLPNDIIMEEIVEESRIVRQENYEMSIN